MSKGSGSGGAEGAMGTTTLVDLVTTQFLTLRVTCVRVTTALLSKGMFFRIWAEMLRPVLRDAAALLGLPVPDATIV